MLLPPTARVLLSFALLAFCPGSDLAGQTPAKLRYPQRELYGFLLDQRRDAFENVLGKPFHSEDATFAYRIPQSAQAYLAISVTPRNTVNMIQLTGVESSVDAGFAGLHMGDSTEKVRTALGDPSKTQVEEDTKLDFWDYAPINLSLEFDHGHLYSIQITSEGNDADDLATSAPTASNIQDLDKALTSGKIENLLPLIDGDVICTQSGKEISVRGQAGVEFLNPKLELTRCLASGASGAVRDIGNAHFEIRITEKLGTLMVAKFPKPDLVEEIVFKPSENRWRIFEVTLR